MIKQNGVRISQCMIVKNEEKNIRKALSWGKDIMFEQIVVDTGSTDRTVEIAKEMGAKVYYFEWIQDFSAAKNFALSKANGDWIAFLDADEYLAEEWVEKLPELLSKLHKTHNIVVCSPLISIQDDGNIISVAKQWRFFRWLPQLQYQNAIHEVLVFEGKMVPNEVVWNVGEAFPIYHTGYATSASEEKNKKQRNLEILMEELKTKPNDSDIMGYIGDCYRGKDNEKVIEWFRKAIDAMPDTVKRGSERSALTFIYLLELLAKQNDMETFMEVYYKAKECVPWVYDVDYLASRYLITQGGSSYEKILYHMQQALAVIEQYGNEAYGIYLFANISEFWIDMAWCYYETGNRKACVQKCVTLLKEDRKSLRTLTILFRALEQEKPEDILHFLSSLYKINDAGDRIIILKAAIQAKAAEFLNIFKSVCTTEEQAVIEQAEDMLEKL